MLEALLGDVSPWLLLAPAVVGVGTGVATARADRKLGSDEAVAKETVEMLERLDGLLADRQREGLHAPVRLGPYDPAVCVDCGRSLPRCRCDIPRAADGSRVCCSQGAVAWPHPCPWHPVRSEQ